MHALRDFQKLIETEHVAAQRLFDTLRAERILLEQRDLAGMQAVLEQKAETMTDLEAIRQRRHSCLKGLGLSSDSNPLHEDQVRRLRELDSDLTDACLSALHRLNALLARCRTNNDLNGLIIVNSRKRNKRRLDILKGVHRDQSLYDAKGQTASAGAQNSARRA